MTLESVPEAAAEVPAEAIADPPAIAAVAPAPPAAPEPANLSLWRALGHRTFALLWAGQTVSRIGDWLYYVALTWWVMQTTGDPEHVAGVLGIQFVPMLVFLLIGGVTVDRLPRAHIMLVSDIGRALLVGGVATLAFAGRLELWHVYVASLQFGLVDAFFQPAFYASIPDAVPERDLPSANSLTSFSMQIGRVLGPGIGGYLLAAVGAPAGFAINAGSFLISGLFLLPLLGVLRPVPRPAEAEGPKGPAAVLADAREGFRTVVQIPWLWISILAFALTNMLLGGPYQVAIPFLVKDNLGNRPELLGWLYAMFPIGYLIGGLYLGRRARIRRRGWMIYLTGATAGLMLAVLGLPVPFVFLALAAIVNGAALEMGDLAWKTALQEKVPRDKLGRVLSLDSLGSFALIPLGLALAALGTDRFGAPLMLLLGGGITAVVTLAALFVRAIRELD
jgi:MFS family permease